MGELDEVVGHDLRGVYAGMGARATQSALRHRLKPVLVSLIVVRHWLSRYAADASVRRRPAAGTLKRPASAQGSCPGTYKKPGSSAPGGDGSVAGTIEPLNSLVGARAVEEAVGEKYRQEDKFVHILSFFVLDLCPSSL